MAVTDVKGSVVETYNYTPYGELIEGEYREDIPFLYNGQYGVTTDSNGLYYMRARYYNIEIKRFINQDVLLGVLERVSSLNRYAYVEGNPISYLDPFGLEKSYNWETYNQHKVISNITYIMACINVSFPNPVSFATGAILSLYDIGLYIYDITQYKFLSKEQKEAVQGIEKNAIGLIPEAGDWCTIIFFLKDRYDNGEL